MSKSHSSSPSTHPQTVEGAQKLLAEVKAAVSVVSPLNAVTRRRHPKIRRGAQQVIPTVAVLGKKYGVEMSSMPMDEAVSNIETAKNLRELLGEVEVFRTALKDTILVSEGNAWGSTTATYSALRRAAKSRPEVATELAAVEAWFRHAPGKAKATTEGTATTPPIPEAPHAATATPAPTHASAPAGTASL